MKTTKMILVALIMAFATIGFTQTKSAAPTLEQSPKISAIVSLRSAMQNPGLVLAMRIQLSSEFLQVERPLYIVSVSYNHSVINVSGTYDDWKRFFMIRVLSNSQKS